MNSLYTISDDYKFQSVASTKTLVPIPTTYSRNAFDRLAATLDKPTQEKINPAANTSQGCPCQRCIYADKQEREFLP
jgi:hypothetical protein